MQSKKYSSSLVIVIFFIVITFFLIKPQTPTQPPPYQGGGAESGEGQIKYVKIAGQSIKVDLAISNKDIVQGLSGRSSLNENEGMLFIFPQSGNYSFWMKDMNFPIDIIWLDENLKVVYIKKDARPELYPETYGPASPSSPRVEAGQGGPETSLQNTKYVLEVVSGFSDKNNLKVGDKIEFAY